MMIIVIAATFYIFIIHYAWVGSFVDDGDCWWY